jgi:hypothetical protein
MDPQQLGTRYRQLLAAYHNGSLSPERFQQACQELRLQDGQGVWWAIDPAAGGWLRYDAVSGAWQPAPPGAGPTSQAPPGPPTASPGAATPDLASVARLLESHPSGVIQGAAVAVVCAVISFVGWIPFSLPPQWFSAMFPPGNCSKYPVASMAMYLCSAKIAAFTLAVPLLTALIVFLLRRRLAALTATYLPKLPQAMRFLVAPAMATLFFVIVWAGAHYQTGGQSGFLPQKLFPAIIGLFTYITGRYGPDLQRSLAGFFDGRDKVPKFLRFVAVLLVPSLIALVITYQERVSATAIKEQLVVLVGLIMGYLMLAPRQGDLLAGIRSMMAGKGQQP